jgi:hypothetical protein
VIGLAEIEAAARRVYAAMRAFDAELVEHGRDFDATPVGVVAPTALNASHRTGQS